MPETTLDWSDRKMRMPTLFGAVPQRGIRCPYNRNDLGPAKRSLWCMIWKNLDEYAKLAPESTQFCRSLCHYGKNYATQRTMVERASESFRAGKWQQLRWLQRWESIKSWWQKPFHPGSG
jgi:hypothetical protein